MGFLDRFLGKPAGTPRTTNGAAAPAPKSPPPASAVAPVVSSPVPAPVAPAPLTPAESLAAQLRAARARLDAQDAPGALAIYEQVLASAADRPDVLTTISGDLGETGHLQPIVELIAPRYDAERHGPATGLNLLQAYLALRQSTPAQHVLDLLFALKRPELDERLWGFSNALADLIEAERRGQSAPVVVDPTGKAVAGSGNPNVALVSISRPLWSYGLEGLADLLPAKPGNVRRIAFAQLAQPGLREAIATAAKPEEPAGRFTRGVALWLAEAFTFAPAYAPIAVVGTRESCYALFPSEWTTEHLRQLVATAGETLDYIVTGAITETHGDSELVLRLWEVKKLRERKQFTIRWTPATADAELAKLLEQVRFFMEARTVAPAALAFAPAASPVARIHALGTALTLFLTDKAVIKREQVATAEAELGTLAAGAAAGEVESLVWLTAAERAARLGLTLPAPAGDAPLAATPLAATPLVAAAAAALGG